MGILLADQRQTTRRPVNPLDKCTVVSIFPKKISENKPTIFPGQFEIEPGTYEKPSILVIGPSSWWKELDDKQPLLEIPNYSIQVADSIVRDYCNGLIAYTAELSQPGIYYVPGSWTLAQITSDKIPNETWISKATPRQLLDRAKEWQTTWYRNLVKLVDGMWAATNGNPKVVFDDARIAAEHLGLTKDWMQDFLMMNQERCPACGTMRNPNYPVCSNCKAILDPAKAKSLGIQFSV